MPINRTQVIHALSRLDVQGNKDGLIPAFNVLVNQFPVALWNTFAERIIKAVHPNTLEAAQFLLVNAAHECGYHTGHGILTSEEWKSVVQPMIVEDLPEDILYGAFAVFTAWGWANAEIVELIPSSRMVVCANDYYEADVAHDQRSSYKTAYMIRGVCAAFMDLAYGAPYPDGIHTFKCEQTKGIECGDPCGEFVVTRA